MSSSMLLEPPVEGGSEVDPIEERTALEAAIAGSIAEIDSLAANVTGVGADLLEFQSAMLSDETLRAPAPTRSSPRRRRSSQVLQWRSRAF